AARTPRVQPRRLLTRTHAVRTSPVPVPGNGFEIRHRVHAPVPGGGAALRRRSYPGRRGARKERVLIPGAGGHRRIGLGLERVGTRVTPGWSPGASVGTLRRGSRALAGSGTEAGHSGLLLRDRQCERVRGAGRARRPIVRVSVA